MLYRTAIIFSLAVIVTQYPWAYIAPLCGRISRGLIHHRLTVAMLRFILMVITFLCLLVFMYLFNHTIVVGRKNLKLLKRWTNLMIVANHLSLIDSWFVVMAIVSLRSFFHDAMMPWQLAEARNYHRGFFGWLVYIWKGLFIRRGSGDFYRRLPMLAELIRQGSLLMFPEGTRNPNPLGGLGPFQPGVGHLAFRSQAQILPIAIFGVQDINPRIPGLVKPQSFKVRCGKRVVIIIGKPFTPSDYYALERKEAVEKITAAIEIELQSLYYRAQWIYRHPKVAQSPIRAQFL